MLLLVQGNALTALFPSQTPNPKLPDPSNNPALGERFQARHKSLLPMASCLKPGDNHNKLLLFRHKAHGKRLHSVPCSKSAASPPCWESIVVFIPSQMPLKYSLENVRVETFVRSQRASSHKAHHPS